MKPLYFNPLSNDTNFVGTNPLRTTGVPIKTTLYPYFNPSIYQSFTFYSFPIQTYYSSQLINTGPLGYEKAVLETGLTFSTTGNIINGRYQYTTIECYSVVAYFSTQCSTFETFYASYLHLRPVTYSVRFGTELQTLIADYNGAYDTYNTYRLNYSTQVLYYSYLVTTTVSNYDLGTSVLYPLALQTIQTGFAGEQVIGSNIIPLAPSSTYLGSSSFVNIMGSNVYTGLIDATNSIVIYQNEQVSSYYSESLSYQVNIANLTAALNSVSGDGPVAAGKGTITVTNFSWAWETTAQGWTGSQLTDFSGYTYQTEVNVYLSVNYGGVVITNSTVAVTQVQSLITVQNNDLANAQTFMNNSVTTLQSQVSLAGQIIGTLSSIMQSIINNI